ncbi:MAG: type II secretion system F family protein [bacterium]|nr:type II secretion system F family protein [bacterium]
MSAAYRYTARTVEGAFVAGTLSSETADRALAHLRARALLVTSLEPARSVRGIVTGVTTILPVGRRERVVLFRSLATLVQAGVALHRALDVCIAQCRDARLREALASVRADIESGSSLSTALGRRPHEWSSLLVTLVRSGELSGRLDDVLERIATMLECDQELRRRTLVASIYPLVVLTAALALVLFLVADTLPTFAAMFADERISLPLTTRVLIALGSWLRSGTAWIAAGAFGCVAAAAWGLLRRLPRLADAVAAVPLALPVIGHIVRLANAARLVRTLGTLLRSGVPLMSALEATREVIGRGPYAAALSDAREALQRGEPFLDAFAASALFESVALHLMHVGVETGELDAMLLRIATNHDSEVDAALAGAAAAIEPLVMLILGAVVATIVSAILVPLYSIIGSIK